MTTHKFELYMMQLIEEAGWIFIDGILRAAEDFFNAVLIDLEGEEEIEVNEKSGPSKKENKDQEGKTVKKLLMT